MFSTVARKLTDMNTKHGGSADAYMVLHKDNRKARKWLKWDKSKTFPSYMLANKEYKALYD